MEVPLQPENDAGDWALVEALFPDASELQGEARARFLDERCAGHPAARAELEGMLAASGDAAFMSGPPAVRATAPVPETLPAGTALGPWTMLGLIGRGGMGEVYLAERSDGAYTLQVAIKVLKRGLDTAALVARFMRERRILARLSHPNIARLIDAGTAPDGRPYLVLEHVSGAAIDAYVRERGLPLRATVELVLTVADAVGEAHRRQIVHRDLKPSNVLVDGAGQVKLLDFGIAKLLAEDEGLTQHATDPLPLTPAYAAPEQLLGRPVTPAVDAYALGVLMFLLLTGRMPHARQGLPAIAVTMGLPDETTPRPSDVVRRAEGLAGTVARRRLARELAGDLDSIVIKALHPDPERRYADAAELAADLRRHLADQPVHARPDALAYRVTRFVRRYRALVAAGAITFSALATGLGVSVWLYARAERSAAVAEAVNEYLNEVVVGIADNGARPTAGLTVQGFLDRVAANIPAALGGDPESAARLHQTVAKAYLHANMALSAIEHYGKAAVIQETLHGTASREHIEMLDALVPAHVFAGDRAQGCKLAEANAALAGGLAGDDPLALTVEFNAVRCLRFANRNAESLERARLLAARARDVKGTYYEGALWEAALAELNLGMKEDAIRHLRELIAYASGIHGERHLRTTRHRYLLGSALAGTYRLDEAEAVLRQVHDDLRQWHGESGQDVITAAPMLAHVYILLHRLDEAEAYALGYLSDAPRAQGNDPEERVSALVALAFVRELQDRCDEALRLLADAQQLMEPESTFHFAAPLRLIRSNCLRTAGDLAAARLELDQAAHALVDELRDRPEEQGEYWRTLGLQLVAERRPAEALEPLERSYVDYQRLGPDSWYTQRARRELDAARALRPKDGPQPPG
jgi:eukaryotic-like serine/threonine-protein kinase